MSRQFHQSTFLITLVFLILSCTPKVSIDLSREVIIPKPALLTPTHSSFTLKEDMTVHVYGDGDGLSKAGKYLHEKLRLPTGFNIRFEVVEEMPSSGICLGLFESYDKELGEEGYELNISQELVRLEANTASGTFKGVQTLLQLFPDKIALTSPQEGPWHIGTGTIRDFPEYEWRSAMLDVSRHFFSVEDVKRYIDFLAFYKMNTLHLHLTDDQGWRIEIKSWPKLTDFGAKTQVGGGKGGFYTQEQYRDIVRYASDRHITIIPEIDMPGHTHAALASYPELNCVGQTPLLYTGVVSDSEISKEYPGLYTGIEVGFSTLCTSQELTYKFLDDVLGEVAAMTPGPYIHVGGDESHVTETEDYIPFIERAQQIVESHGKKMIGWDETAQSKLTATTLVQLWHSPEFAKQAISQGNKLIMSPANKAYMDMQYDSTSRIGLHWAAYIEVDDAYNWDPTTVIEGINREDIVGIEVPLWTETVLNMDDIEYLVFPRFPGYAEIAWTKPEDRNWEEYKTRLARHSTRMKNLEIDYFASDRVPWPEENID